MDDSMGAGFMAVIAVSGSIVFLSLQIHKRLLSDFMNKIESELGSLKAETKKRVKFSQEVENKDVDYSISHVKNENAAAVVVASENNGKCGGVARRVKVDKQNYRHGQIEDSGGSTMPLNWQVLYKGILEYRKLSTPCF